MAPILRNTDRFIRTLVHTLSALGAGVFVNLRFVVFKADCLQGADIHAQSAPAAFFLIYLDCHCSIPFFVMLLSADSVHTEHQPAAWAFSIARGPKPGALNRG